MKKYVITNVITNRKYTASMLDVLEDGSMRFPKEKDLKEWYSRGVALGKFGKTARDYVYKREIYKITESGNRILSAAQEFPFKNSSYETIVESMDESEREEGRTVVKDYIYKLKDEFSKKEESVSTEFDDMKSKKTAREECCDRLRNINWSETTTVAKLKSIVKDLVEYLEV